MRFSPGGCADAAIFGASRVQLAASSNVAAGRWRIFAFAAHRAPARASPLRLALRCERVVHWNVEEATDDAIRLAVDRATFIAPVKARAVV